LQVCAFEIFEFEWVHGPLKHLREIVDA
jgi:hypothetical protein